MGALNRLMRDDGLWLEERKREGEREKREERKGRVDRRKRFVFITAPSLSLAPRRVSLAISQFAAVAAETRVEFQRVEEISKVCRRKTQSK
jgi:hypothetical protein